MSTSKPSSAEQHFQPGSARENEWKESQAALEQYVNEQEWTELHGIEKYLILGIKEKLTLLPLKGHLEQGSFIHAWSDKKLEGLLKEIFGEKNTSGAGDGRGNAIVIDDD